jgi:hypothetical protein
MSRRIGATSNLNSGLQQAAIHVSANETRPEIAESALRKSGLSSAEVVKHHLDTEIDHRQFHQSGIRGRQISLNQSGHRHQCWSDGAAEGRRETS